MDGLALYDGIAQNVLNDHVARAPGLDRVGRSPASIAGSFTRGCAARDLQTLTMIEASENSDAISTRRLKEIINTLMHARIVCHEGRVIDALALYEGIAQVTNTSNSM